MSVHRLWSTRQQLVVLCGDEGVAERWLALLRVNHEQQRDVIDWLDALRDGIADVLGVEQLDALGAAVDALRVSLHELRQYELNDEITP